MSTALIPSERIESKIYLIRGKKVMIDRDLAELYGVETRRLNERVKRNLRRFPSDFMFQLNEEEFRNWKSHFATSNKDKMGLRKRSLVFTQEGVAMLSSILNSERAIDVNIAIMRAFVKLREIMISHTDLARKIEDLERKFKDHDEKIMLIFDAIRQLMTPPEESKKNPIGFLP